MNSSPSLLEGVIYLLGIIFLFMKSRAQSEDVKSNTQIESNKVQIKIDDQADKIVKKSELSREEMRSLISNLESKLMEREDLQDIKVAALAYNIHRMCKKVGVEWIEEVTVIKKDE